MNSLTSVLEVILEPFNNKRLASLSGQLDEHLKQIEKRLNVDIRPRGNCFQIKGEPQNIGIAKQTLKQLYQKTNQEIELTPSHIHLCIQELSNLNEKSTDTKKNITLNTPKKNIQAKNNNQQQYLKKIFTHDINFGIGPAGTGKTYLAVACAICALETSKVNKILLVRPAVEAGERLGFLPGDLTEKINPYLRPIYDALYEFIGMEQVNKLISQEVIEIASLAYMRGRTLDDAFIILDEAQNVTCKQMKMFLTRIGFSSTTVITGDITQIDLPKGEKSGLEEAIKILSVIEEISFTWFKSADVVRHPIVQKIIDAYDKFTKLESRDKL